jgi:hypothetical protein
VAKKNLFQQEDRRGHRSTFRQRAEKKVSAPHWGCVVGPVKVT